MFESPISILELVKSVGSTMSRLRGWVAGLGLPVSMLVAYIFLYQKGNQPFPEGQSMPELSQEALNASGAKFRRYKQEMTDEQRALFTQDKVDGKGHAQFFVIAGKACSCCWARSKTKVCSMMLRRRA
jgi:hypothetical protein